jgi:G3E family GTPase
VRLVAVSGIQGSGKTTLVREMIVRSSNQGMSCGVIVNEDGQVKYDDQFLLAHQVTLKAIRGG